MRNTLVADAVIPRNGRMNCAQLKLIPTRAAISPMMFNHATNQPDAGPPSAAAQWYMAPDVGYAEQSSAMLAANSRVKRVATGHPRVISSGPPISRPYP